MIKLSEVHGQVYDVSYNPPEWCYDSDEDFINDYCDTVIEGTIKFFPNDYQEKEDYIECTAIKNSQKISKEDFYNLMDSYSYRLCETTV